MKRTVIFMLIVGLFAISMTVGYVLGSSVLVEFFYWDPSQDPNMCWTCSGWVKAYYDFLNKWSIVDELESKYAGYIIVQRIEWDSNSGRPRNSIVINHEYVFFENFTVTDVEKVIENYLSGGQPTPQTTPPLPFVSAVVMAYTFGFFETFSPCLIALLSFVLSYTIAENLSFKGKFLRVSLFAFGFATAAVLIFSVVAVGLAVASVVFGFQYVMMWIVFGFAIIFGLDLMGLNLSRLLGAECKAKPLVQSMAKKYVISSFGFVLLGFSFYFLDPCIAPVFVVMISTFSSDILFTYLPLLLLVFILGVITPFIVVGILSGSISKLARDVYRHRAKIRATSGIILICYAFYLLSTVLIPSMLKG
jgi:cytochrome c biogenesis protein CcdA